jgi:benzoyl-CoA reductase/2-hydroxyglutaryl-CoA dehydratase subunit BcrC/BadD/HgdB
VVDVLSKRVHEMHATTINMYSSNLKSRILEVVKLDQHYLQVKASLQQANLQQKYKNYMLEEDGILLYKNKVCVPNSQELRNLVLKEMQNLPHVGHPRYQKKIVAIRGEYFFPGMKKDMVDYIARCMEC